MNCEANRINWVKACESIDFNAWSGPRAIPGIVHHVPAKRQHERVLRCRTKDRLTTARTISDRRGDCWHLQSDRWRQHLGCLKTELSKPKITRPTDTIKETAQWLMTNTSNPQEFFADISTESWEQVDRFHQLFAADWRSKESVSTWWV